VTGKESGVLDGHYLAFLGTALLLTVTPGADMALVTRHVLVNGPRTGLQVTLGIVTGLLVWATLSAVGLAALLNASATAFTALRIVGGAYLVFLGIQALWRTRPRDGESPAEATPARAGEVTGPVAYRQGLMSNLLNPKVGVFYATFLPQFVVPDAPVYPQLLLLSLAHIVIGLLWLMWYVRIVDRAGAWLRQPRIRQWLDRMTGAVLVALGVRLAAPR
jgi:RhtB (resistance to homoserine/threonine) family protein